MRIFFFLEIKSLMNKIVMIFLFVLIRCLIKFFSYYLVNLFSSKFIFL